MSRRSKKGEWRCILRKNKSTPGRKMEGGEPGEHLNIKRDRINERVTTEKDYKIKIIFTRCLGGRTRTAVN